MRVVKSLAIFLLAFSVIAIAKENKLGVHDVSRVNFGSTVHIGANVLPAGQYVVRHIMDGQDHVMVFKRNGAKEEFKVKCTLVPLAKNAPRDEAIYSITAGNERVLQELVFQGDSAKHVF